MPRQTARVEAAGLATVGLEEEIVGQGVKELHCFVAFVSRLSLAQVI